MNHLTPEHTLAFLRGELEASLFESVAEHLGQCPACTEECDLIAHAMRQRKGMPWRSVLPALALLLLGLLAGGAAVYFRWLALPDFIAPDERPGQRLSSLREAALWRIEEAQLPESARYHTWVEFVHGGTEKASAVAVELPASGGLDLCGFAANGRYLWSLRRSWEAWAAILGRRTVSFEALRCLVTRRTRQGELEETICLVVRRQSDSCVILVDPQTGAIRGHTIYSGSLGRTVLGGDPISVLPAPPDVRRTVVVAGQYGSAETATPALVVLQTDGTLVQDIHFPTIEGPRSAFWARHLIVDWYGTPPVLLVQLTDDVHFEFLVRHGRLEEPEARVSGGLQARFNTRRGEHAWEQLEAAAGGYEGLMRAHADRVKSVDGPRSRKRWRDD